MADEEDWAPIPKIRPADCPPGLECLISVDQVIIGFGQGNKHSVNNSRGQKLFFVLDGSNCCVKRFCCDCKSFKTELLDHYGNALISLQRSSACCCCKPEMRVFAPLGTCIGTVKQTSALLRKSYAVYDAREQQLLIVKGSSCTQPKEHKILREQGETVGRMSKAWADLDRILFGKQTLVGVSFPLDLDVRLKTNLIGACFLAYR